MSHRRRPDHGNVTWVWLLWSERRPTDRAVTGPMSHRAGPNRPSVTPGRSQAPPGTRHPAPEQQVTRGARDAACRAAAGPVSAGLQLTPEEPHPCHIAVLAVAASMRTSGCQCAFERGVDSGRLTCRPAALAFSPPD